MNKKIICILAMTMLIGTVLSATGSIEKNSYLTEKNEPLVFLDPMSGKEIQYIIVEANTESNIDKSMVQSLDNLAPNPSFENGNDVPDGWTCDTFGLKASWDDTEAHSGQKSVSTFNLERNDWHIEWMTEDFIPINLRDNTYELSTWYKYNGIPEEMQYGCTLVYTCDENYEPLIVYIAYLDYSEEWIYGQTFTSWFLSEYVNQTSYIKIGVGQCSLYSDYNINSDVEVRFDDVFFGLGETNPPNKPEIPVGPPNGKPGENYTYSSSAVDPDDDYIEYFFDWGDGNTSGWLWDTEDEWFYESGETVYASHIYVEEGTYDIRVKARDIWEQESPWSDPLQVSMPKNKPINTPFLQFLDNYPHLFPLLRQLLGLQ